MAKPRLSEGRIPFQLGIDIGITPPIAPFHGDAYLYDETTGTGPIAGAIIIDGPDQDSPTGTIAGGTVQPGPNQDSPTGSITGGTLIENDYRYD